MTTAWLIEAATMPLCYSSGPKPCWVDFSDPQAWRFGTKEEAERVIKDRGLIGVSAVEHGWG
jgi:hypothetical protein